MKNGLFALMFIAAVCMMVGAVSAVTPADTESKNVDVYAQIVGTEITVTPPTSVPTWSLDKSSSTDNENMIGNANVKVTGSVSNWDLAVSGSNDGKMTKWYKNTGEVWVYDVESHLVNAVDVYSYTEPNQYYSLGIGTITLKTGTGNVDMPVPVYLKQKMSVDDISGLDYKITLTFTGTAL